MNLDKMLVAQKELDRRIIKAKELEGKDLFPNTVVALQVELAEFANEGRWFKHWSNDQEPRKSKYVLKKEFQHLHITQTGAYEYQLRDEFGKVIFDDVTDLHHDHKNPLLEEYVDCVHFFLSIAIQKGWQDALYIYQEQLDIEEFDGGLTGIFLEMSYFINKSHFENPSKEKDEKFKMVYGFSQKPYWFRTAWTLFLNIGIHGFGFSLEQIEQAYFEKNQINHKRQDEGY